MSSILCDALLDSSQPPGDSALESRAFRGNVRTASRERWAPSKKPICTVTRPGVCGEKKLLDLIKEVGFHELDALFIGVRIKQPGRRS